ncbi:hypothetical protein K3495_g6808 [Podosphaera aphanis]|nr:hypothetical protein K3495_g6808 [Podosphaera aphanis]
MSTYMPIYLYQGIATRSAVRATPRPPVQRPARPPPPKHKTECVFHFPRIKGDLMIIHRLSRFIFSKSDPSEPPIVSASDPRTPITGKGSDITSAHAEKKGHLVHPQEFLTPVNQVGIIRPTSSRSRFSEMTVSTSPENLDEYRKENSSAGFWSPVAPPSASKTRGIESTDSTPDVKCAPFAPAFHSPVAARYRDKFAAESIMVSPESRAVENFINDMIATLAAIYPRSALKLLSMRHTLFVDLMTIEAHRNKTQAKIIEKNNMEKTELKRALQRAEEQVETLTTRLKLQQGIIRIFERKAKDAEEMKNFLEGSIKLYEERTRSLRAKVETEIDEALLERRNEAARVDGAARREKGLRDRVKKLERAVRRAQKVFQEGQRHTISIHSDPWCGGRTNISLSSSTLSNELDSINTLDDDAAHLSGVN